MKRNPSVWVGTKERSQAFVFALVLLRGSEGVKKPGNRRWLNVRLAKSRVWFWWFCVLEGVF